MRSGLPTRLSRLLLVLAALSPGCAFAYPPANEWISLTVDPSPIYSGGFTTLFTHAEGGGGTEGAPWCEGACSTTQYWRDATFLGAMLFSGDGRSQPLGGPWTLSYATPGTYTPRALGAFEINEGWSSYNAWYQTEMVWDDCAIPGPDVGVCHGGYVEREVLHSTNESGRSAPYIRELEAVGNIDVLPLPPTGPGPVPGSFVFTFMSNRDGPIFFDPPIAIGYQYHIDAGPNVASVLVPAPLPNGDGAFTLVLGGDAFPLIAGEPFDVLAHVPAGVSAFSILDINANEALNPEDPLAFVVGLTFVGDGQVTLTQTAVVPEPETVWLMAAGIAAVGFWGRRRAAARRVA